MKSTESIHCIFPIHFFELFPGPDLQKPDIPCYIAIHVIYVDRGQDKLRKSALKKCNVRIRLISKNFSHRNIRFLEARRSVNKILTGPVAHSLVRRNSGSITACDAQIMSKLTRVPSRHPPAISNVSANSSASQPAGSQAAAGMKRKANAYDKQYEEAVAQYHQKYGKTFVENMENEVREELTPAHWKPATEQLMEQSLRKESFSQQVGTLKRAYICLLKAQLFEEYNAEIAATVRKLADALKGKLCTHCGKDSREGIKYLEEMMACLLQEFACMQAIKIFRAALQNALEQKATSYYEAMNAEMIMRQIRKRGKR